jgi:hypothetical protein
MKNRKRKELNTTWERAYLKERDYLGDLNINGRAIFKMCRGEIRDRGKPT